MIIQRVVISEDKSELYFRGGKAGGGSVFIQSGESLSFDTYFNSFTYTKYRAYTALTEISFTAVINGKAELSLITFGGKEEVTVATAMGEGEITASVDITALPDGAFLYAKLVALSDTEFLSAQWHSEVEKTFEPSIAIAFCTYKREEYLLNNLDVLRRADIPYLSKILVVDNGNTLDRDKLEDELVSLFPNPNFGGSAGFTRGIIEAKSAGASHVILMDDDVVIFPEAFARISALLSILRPEFKNAHVSAAMLKASDISIQYEKGALWNGSHIESLNSSIDVTERESLVDNLTDGPIKYGAWWCFCMPVSDMDEYGLPLPMFIKFDDVEYGTRTCKNAPIITMSGIAVAHADFDLKYSMHLEYYTIRNQLIMLASHGMQGTLGCLIRLIKVSAKHLFMYRYEAAPIILRAFSDFLFGADFIKNTNAEELNRSVMSMAPKAIPLSEIPAWSENIRAEYKEKKRDPLKIILASLTLGGHIIPNFLLSKKTSFAPLPTAKVYDCFLRKTTVQYQTGSDSGYVFKKNSARFFRIMLSLIKMSFKILFGYKKAAKSYRESFAELTSEDFFKKYLGLN